MTPEQIAASIIDAVLISEDDYGVLRLEVAAALRAYGAERARQERERCARVAQSYRPAATKQAWEVPDGVAIAIRMLD